MTGFVTFATRKEFNKQYLSDMMGLTPEEIDDLIRNDNERRNHELHTAPRDYLEGYPGSQAR